MDAVSASAFEVVEFQFFLGLAEAVLDRPVVEGDADDFPQCPAIAIGNAVGDEVFDFAGDHIPGDDERALIADDLVVVSLPPAGGPANLPDFASVVRVLDTITLRRLLRKAGEYRARLLTSLAGR